VEYGRAFRKSHTNRCGCGEIRREKRHLERDSSNILSNCWYAVILSTGELTNYTFRRCFAAASNAPGVPVAIQSPEEIHSKDLNLVVSVNQLSEAVELKELPGTNWSAKNYQLFKEMQRARRSV
jgi:hypothetical protein